MLYFLVVWTGLLGVCLVVGCGWLHGLRAHAIASPAERFILSAWLGLSTLAIVSLAAALFVPLSAGASLILALLAMCPALASLPARAELASWWQRGYSKWRLVQYGLSALIIAAFVGKAVDWIDTGAYHYGLIRWFSEHGVTPGLALLNPQFGFVSAWFTLAAPFNPASSFIGLEGRASNVMNGFVLLLAGVQIAIASRCILAKSVELKSNQLNSWFLLIFSLLVCLFSTQTPFLSRITASASPDIAIALFSVVIPWSMLVVDAARRSPQASFNIYIIPTVLAAAAFSIKLTALPLLPIALGFYLFKSIALSHWAKGISLALLLVLPFLITQTIISGYPLYPSTALHFGLPWTRSIADVQDLANNTHGWAHWFGQPPAEANRFIWLLAQWLASTYTSKLMGGLIILSIGSILYLLSSTKNRNNYGFIWLQLISALGITFTMLKAPLFRFGMGYVLLLPVLLSAMLCSFTFRRVITERLGHINLSRSWNSYVLTAFLLCIAIVSVQANSTVHNYVVFTRSLPVPPLQRQQVNGIDYNVTQDQQRQCWAANLPCVASIPSGVQLRSPRAGIKGGFVYNSALDRL